MAWPITLWPSHAKHALMPAPRNDLTDQSTARSQVRSGRGRSMLDGGLDLPFRFPSPPFVHGSTAHSLDSSLSSSSALRPTAVRPPARGQYFRHRPARPHPPVHVIPGGRRASYGSDSPLSSEERQRCAPGRRSAVRAGLQLPSNLPSPAVRP